MHVVEPPTRLSHSLLWELQRAFFEDRGVAAWREGIVPTYVTTNAFIASRYALLVRAWLADQVLDPGEPVHIVELGGGSGNFAFLLLEMLRGAPVRYILTDLAERNLAAWQSHPSLRPWVDAGLLDFAVFDATTDTELRLRTSGEFLRATRNPIVVVANYFFDSIPCDAFVLEAGVPHELRIGLVSPQPEPNRRDPAMLERVGHRWETAPAEALDDPELDALLALYAARLPDATVRIPTAGLRTTAALARISGDRMLLLSCDKGSAGLAEQGESGPPGIALHGSVSLAVNYHAIGEWFRARGGQLLHPEHRATDVLVVAGLLGGGPLQRTRAAWEEVVAFGPDEFFSLKTALGAPVGSFTLPQILAWLRLGRFDPRLLARCLPVISDLVAGAEERHLLALPRVLDEAWALYYHLDDRRDLAFEIGALLTEIGQYRAAIRYFARSMELYGPNPSTWYNMSLCAYHLEERERALLWADEALRMHPGHERAEAMRSALT